MLSDFSRPLCVSFSLVPPSSMVFSSIEYLEEIVFVSEKADPRDNGKCFDNLRFYILLAKKFSDCYRDNDFLRVSE